LTLSQSLLGADEDMPPASLIPAPAEPFALFLDFDGTLVDIAHKPDAVTVAPGLPATLARLRERLGGALALVSGRPIGVLDGFLAPERFDAAGLHGAEQRIGGVVQVDVQTDPARLRPFAAELRAFAARHPGLILEDKQRSLALHWRLAPDHAGQAADVMAATVQAIGSDYRLQEGKNVLEIVPRWATKGAAIARFLDVDPYAGRLPVFVGDDVTDEHGFEVVAQHGGLTVRIGEGPSRASHRLPDPTALRRLLADWSEGPISS
jgi:trehalose 6-phosphate phosphatase